MPRVLALSTLAAAAVACVQFLGSVPLAAASASQHCVRWRATGGCDPHGVREAHNDATCDKKIANGLSGYCECEDRRRVREVTCDHHEFTCKAACAEDSSADLAYATGFEYVTCGSSIKLAHEATRFRLHSHEIAYGGGSGQQSVTAHASRNDRNSYWLVKEGDSAPGCPIGERIRCGATIRLEHVMTRRNLHTHSFPAPLTSGHDEVSGYGVAGDGDALDSWVVECVDSQQCSVAGACDTDDGSTSQWTRGSLVRLRSTGTGKYLVTSPHARFDDSNCPRCPINGQQEVSAAATAKSDNTLWFVDEGVFAAM